MEEYEGLLLEKKDGIGTMTLNNPERLNALTAKMEENLCLAGDEIAKDDEVKVLIVTGAGRGFCSGADLSGRASRRGSEAAEVSRSTPNRLMERPYTDVFLRLNKPVIAAINGPCAGAGFAIALSCDIRIASEAATFTEVFVSRGMTPHIGITYWLPRTIGTAKALELMWTGKKISAAEAERLGIVSRVVPPNDLMKVVRELAAKIAQQPPIPVELTKRIVYRTMKDVFNRHVDLENWGQQIAGQTEDTKEAVRAFLEKRPPAPFKGR